MGSGVAPVYDHCHYQEPLRNTAYRNFGQRLQPGGHFDNHT